MTIATDRVKDLVTRLHSEFNGDEEMKYATADASKLAVPAEPLNLTLGLEARAFAGPRPDLNGLRIVHPGNGAVYLILDGHKSHIPNPPTYNNLFRSWEGIITDIDVTEIPTGPTLTDGAILAVRTGGGAVYLISNGVKRHVVSPLVMDQYHFAWNRIVGVPPALLDSIPTGPNINPR
jgi:hypothetical protein